MHNFSKKFNGVLNKLIWKTPQNEIIPVLIHSSVFDLYKFLVSTLFDCLKFKYNISGFEKDLEKDLEKDMIQRVGLLFWFITM